MRISDWSSDLCSSDLARGDARAGRLGGGGDDPRAQAHGPGPHERAQREAALAGERGRPVDAGAVPGHLLGQARPPADVPAQGILRDPGKGHRPLPRGGRGGLPDRAQEQLTRGRRMLTLVLVVIFAALVFEFINGFHDTANSIATVVATKVLTPGQAVILAAVMNLKYEERRVGKGGVNTV